MSIAIVENALKRVLLVLIDQERGHAAGDAATLKELGEMEGKAVGALSAIAEGQIVADDDKEMQSLAKSLHSAKAKGIEAGAAAPVDPERMRLRSYFRLWCTLFLDVTFVEENRTIGQADLASEQQFRRSVDYTYEPARLLRQAGLAGGNDGDERSERELLLSVYKFEQVEAIYWRRGAMYYMYAATLDGQRRLVAMASDDMWKGVAALRSMLTINNVFAYPEVPAQTSASLLHHSMLTAFASEDYDSESLQNKGINSSTSLLAIMYSVELLKWLHDRASASSLPPSEPMTAGQIQGVALALIHVYLDTLQTVMANSGWTADRAIDLWQALDPISHYRESAAIVKALTSPKSGK